MISVIVAALLVALFIVLNSLGVFFPLNEPVNNLVSGEPKTHCVSDQDCALKSTGCGFCECQIPVNKNWNKFCLFKKPNIAVDCAVCFYPGPIGCVEGVCKFVAEDSAINQT